MKAEDIKNPALKKLYSELKNSSSTIQSDSNDALRDSEDDTEFIENWQMMLMGLYEECQHYWGELEGMKK